MCAQLKSPVVQEQGCLTIAAMVPRAPLVCGTVLKTLAAAGIVRAVIDAATVHRGCAAVQAAAFAVFARVATPDLPEAQEEVGSIANIKLITSALSTFGADAAVQICGYHALQSITEGAPEIRTKALLSFDFESAARSLREHFEANTAVQRAALDFVANVAYDRARSTSCVSTKTVAPFLCSIPLCADVVTESLSAEKDEAFCVFVMGCLAEGGMDLEDHLRGALFSFLERRASSAETMLSCLKALKGINLDEMTKNLIKTRVRPAHPDNKEIQRLIDDLL